MVAALKARPTEYKGICYRSKSEAMFARWLDLTRSKWSLDSSKRRGAFGHGCGWIYEPDWLRVDDWTPDFYVWHSLWVPTICIDIEIIEYKPSEPTESYVDEMCDRVGKMQLKLDEKMMVYYGSPYTAERGVISFVKHPDYGIQMVQNEIDWIGVLSDALTEYRYDLKD